MSIFREFPKKTLYAVAQILVNSQNESIIHYLEEFEDNYWLNDSIENISLVPAYQFAVACSLASLGNPAEAERIFNNPESYIESDVGESKSQSLFNDFMV